MVLKTTIAQRTGIMPYVEGKVTYANIVQFSDSSMTKNVLYNNALMSIAAVTTKFNNNITNKTTWGLKDNITIKDSEVGEVVAACRVFVKQAFNEWIMEFTLTIRVKDLKYKYECTSLYMIGSTLANGVAGKNYNFQNSIENFDIKSKKELIKKANEAMLDFIGQLSVKMADRSALKDF
jgi:hypothetical protein